MRRLTTPSLQVSFDLVGASFAKGLTVRPRSPESRSDKFSFLRELTSEQMATYTPSQISVILGQRENVLRVAEGECRSQKTQYFPSYSKNSAVRLPPGFGYTDYTKPWVVSEAEECQFKCCHTCRRSAQARAFLSLDGIVQGDIPPTAAVGFGFHRAGTRPVIDPDRLMNIGLRAVPWPKACSPPTTSSQSSESSEFSYLEIIDYETDEVAHMEPPRSQLSRDSSASGSVSPTEPENGSHIGSIQPPLPPMPVKSSISPLKSKRSIAMEASLIPLPPPPWKNKRVSAGAPRR
ncbi:hypothetical protein AAE478_003553 [Parahypoxylon ruwenzoriense]